MDSYTIAFMPNRAGRLPPVQLTFDLACAA